MPKKIFSLLAAALFSCILSFSNICFADNPPASQQMSGEERSRQMQEQEKKLRQEVEKPKEKAKIEEKIPEEAPAEKQAAAKIPVKDISVIGVTIFPAAKINSITEPFKNKELGLKEIQKIADLITDLYRQKGYITSRAYIPPQKIEDGKLEIRVLEASVGDIQVKGNRFYSTRVIRRYINVKTGELFNYNGLQRDLLKINEHPDRNAKAILTPGKEPGSTDIVLEVKDSLPLHLSLGYDNFASRFVRRNRYIATATDNNLLGRDDILNIQYLRGEANNYYSYSANYLYPLTKTLNIGFLASRSKIVLGKEFTDVESRGKSRVFSLYGSQNLIKNENLIFDLNFGFDYKDVYNFLLGDISSQDRLRIAKTGFNLDVTDNFGRTIITNDFNYGFPHILGGTKAHLQPTDKPTSRTGAGGEFLKDTLNLLRLQRLIFDATLLWKNQMQFSPSILTATEQFQAGGPANNRGYPPAEFVGDRGYSMSWELAAPIYFVPKSFKIPFSKSRIYDALRIIGFYDWTNLHLKNLQPTDKRNMTIRSAGCGIRLNILEDFSLRYEIGWPLDKRPSDGKNTHQWFELTKTF